MSRRHRILHGPLLALAAVALSACGGADVVKPTPLGELSSPAYRMVELWHTDGGDGAGEYIGGFRPAVEAGRVYVANRDGDVVAIDLDSGRHIWRARTDERLTAGPTVAGGHVLVGTRDGRIVALSADSGEREWAADLSSEVVSAPAAADGTAVARTLDGRVVALALDSGERRWSVERKVPTLTLRGTSSPVIDDGVVYAGLDNGNVIALDLATGRKRWEQVIALPSGRSELDRIVDVDADPLVLGNELYAASVGGEMASLSVTSGRRRWKHELSSDTGLAYNDRYIFTTDRDSNVWAINRITGAKGWQQDALEYRRLSAPAVYRGDVLVGDFEGYVHWLSADSGSVIARGRAFGEAIRSAPVVAGDRVIVLGADGEVAALRFAPVGADQ